MSAQNYVLLQTMDAQTIWRETYNPMRFTCLHRFYYIFLEIHWTPKKFLGLTPSPRGQGLTMYAETNIFFAMPLKSKMEENNK